LTPSAAHTRDTFLGHGSILYGSGQLDGLQNIGGLRRFVAATQHHDQYRAVLEQKNIRQTTAISLTDITVLHTVGFAAQFDID